MKKTLITLLLSFSAVSIYAKDIQELIVTTVPQMSCQNCENKIKGNLRFEKGVKNIETNLKDQRVTVTYDAEKTNPENIEKAFGKIGYRVSVIEEDGKTVCPEENTNGEPACCAKGGEPCCRENSPCCKK